MQRSLKRSALETITSNPDYLFWALQLAGWSWVGVITFFTFTVWNEAASTTHILHILFQSLQGMLLSWPLRWIFTAIWGMPALWRIGLSLASVTVVAALWTYTRMETFMWMSGEQGLLAEFSSWYFGGFFIMACWAALYYSFKYYRLTQQEHEIALRAEADAGEQMYERMKAEALARDAQLKMLRYQLNPHFLFNTLNAIYALIKLKETQASQKMVQQLSKLLRYSLDSDPLRPVSLAREVEVLQLYINIEKTRFAERLNLQFDFPEATLRAQVPSLLLQPLVENAVKHAISLRETGGTIGISARIKDEMLCLEVWDSGPGIDADCKAEIEGSGTGLRNTEERLRAMYDDSFTLELGTAQAGGLLISIEIPYQSIAVGTEDEFTIEKLVAR